MSETVDHEKVIEECERAQILLENIREAARQKTKRNARLEATGGPAVRRASFQFPTRIVAVALVVTALAMVVPIFFRLRETPPPALTAADFHFVDESMGRVLARPPHVYVTMEASRWGSLSELDRQQLVEDVGKKASTTGYVGAHFLTTDGRLLAQWRRDSGVKLFDKN